MAAAPGTQELQGIHVCLRCFGSERMLRGQDQHGCQGLTVRMPMICRTRDAGYDAVNVGDRVDGAGDGIVEVLGRASLVLACEVEFGAELVECDAGLEQLADTEIAHTLPRR